MDNAVLVKFLHDQFKTNRDFYVKDLEALSEEALSTPFAGNARTPYDITFEVVEVNKRVHARLAGVEPGPWPFADGWATAPESFKYKVIAIAELVKSVDAIVEAMGDDMSKVIESAQGPKTVFEIAAFAPLHMMYHDAQLNYVQSLHGDSEMHWM